MFTTLFQLIKSIHRDVYLVIDLINSALSAKGKIVIITEAIEAVSLQKLVSS